MNEHTDTSLTDYALNELDAAARTEVERRLAADPAAQAEVDELTALARSLRRETSRNGQHPIEAEPSALRETVERRLATRATTSTVSIVHVLPQPPVVGFLSLSARWKVLAGVGSLAALATSALFMALTYMPAEKERLGSNFCCGDRGEPSGYQEELVVKLSTPPSPGFAHASAGPSGPIVHAPTPRTGPSTQASSGPARSSRVSEPEFIPYKGDLQFFKQPDLSRIGKGGKPPEGWFGMAEYRNSGLQAPSTPQTGKSNVPAPGSPQPAMPSSGAVVPNRPSTVRLDVGEPLMVTDLEQKGLPTAQRSKSEPLAGSGDVSVADRRKLAELEAVKQLRDVRGEVAFDTEAYDAIVENPFVKTLDAPLSTFSIDVDTASYANVRRFLASNQLPPPGAVRLEEFVNYFTYDYPQPTGDDPFAVTTEAARCPWNAEHVLVRVGLKGREIHRRERPATNLVFLVDVSGSMNEPNKLPLVRESLKMLTRELGDGDRVAIVVYAGRSGLVLDSTGGDRKQTILEALDRLSAGGGTNGAAGIQLAYRTATTHFIRGGVNRVVLATDGDFNVGVTSQDELVRLIEEQAKSGVFFSALGYGMGNLKDSTLEKLADKGNGNYAYIDTPAEARKVLVEQMSGTLVTIAKDVKIQIEFNPTRVAGYRLLGYENRLLAAQDFNDDKKDAGEIGAGHTVTALYELIPAGKSGARETAKLPTVDPLKYQQPKPTNEPSKAAAAAELLTLKLRYKQPDGDVSKLIERPLKDDVQPYAKASGDFKFAASVAGFGMLLRKSQFAGGATFDAVLELAAEGIGRDEGGYRREFLELVRKAKGLAQR